MTDLFFWINLAFIPVMIITAAITMCLGLPDAFIALTQATTAVLCLIFNAAAFAFEFLGLR